MNQIETLFQQKPNNILSIYFTAGYPEKNSTVSILQELEQAGVDLVEVGIPFSDPVADGPVIQQSSQQAIENGMTLKLLLQQLKEARKTVSIPLILMGYLNPILQMGLENFCREAEEAGVAGLIIPDLPLDQVQGEYKSLFEKHRLANILLITPQTSDERIQQIDAASNGFVYMVSSSSTTGVKKGLSAEQLHYFERIQKLQLKNPQLIGFGIGDHASFSTACSHANGAIVGSAFIKALNNQLPIADFVRSLRGKS